MTIETASAIGRHAAETVALFSVAGMLAGLWRYRWAERPDLLRAVLVFLLGTAIAQLPVYIGGMTGWGPDLVLVSAIGRYIQCAGCALFVRGSLKGQAPPWAWWLITVFILIVARFL